MKYYAKYFSVIYKNSILLHGNKQVSTVFCLSKQKTLLFPPCGARGAAPSSAWGALLFTHRKNTLLGGSTQDGVLEKSVENTV